MLLMRLAEEKGCWLCDILRGDIPASELTLWIEYYKIKREEQKKAERNKRGVASMGDFHKGYKGGLG